MLQWHRQGGDEIALQNSIQNMYGGLTKWKGKRKVIKLIGPSKPSYVAHVR